MLYYPTLDLETFDRKCFALPPLQSRGCYKYGAKHSPLGCGLGDSVPIGDICAELFFCVHNRVFHIVNIVKIKNDMYLWNKLFEWNSILKLLGRTV